MTGISSAQDTPSSTLREGQSFLYLENDSFDFLGDSTDRWYTQGLRFERINSPEESGDNFLFGLNADFWCVIACEEVREDMTGWAVGQSIFTPEILDDPAPQPLDRPWAGHLYATRLAQVRQRVPIRRMATPVRELLASRTDRFELEIGVVGEASGAEWAQTRWHELIDDVEPLGWDNQLPNELTVQTAFRSEFRLLARPEWSRPLGIEFALQPHYGWALGTRQVSAEFGMHLETGWNLLDPGEPGRPGRTPERHGWFQSGSLFAAFTGRHVQHNIFLDGTLFSPSPGVTHRKPVWETAMGLQLNVYGPYDLVYRFRRRGSEFVRPSGASSNIQEFASITLIRRY